MKSKKLQYIPMVVALGVLFNSATALTNTIADQFDGIESSDIRPSPIDGLHEVTIDSRIVYVSTNGQYLLKGELIDIASNTNLTRERVLELRRELLNSIGDERLIRYQAENPHTSVMVVVDTSCQHCKKLHSEIQDLTANGIQVDYLLYAPAGPGSVSWLASDAIWCSSDRKRALDRAMLEKKIPVEEGCTGSAITRENYEVAQALDVQGTPTFFLDNGRRIAGYRSAEELRREASSLRQ